MNTNTPSASRRAIAGWVLFDWATQPYFTLVTTFVYAPFFAAAVARDAAEGQALWGFASSAAGLVIAVLAPLLGAVADAAGRRKPWIAAFGVLAVTGAALLWLGRPGHPETIPLVLFAFAMGAVGVQGTIVFSNAMMPALVPPRRLGWLSGIGWAVGYVGGLLSLVLTLGFLAASPQTGKTLLGLSPLLGLDPLAREGDRIVGPLSALWFALFALPLFLFTPDQPARLRVGAAMRQGVATLVETLRHLPRYREVMIFLLANMIYADGLVALFAFGGIYAAGTFGWTVIEIGIFGILLVIAGIFGALLGSALDDRLRSKPVILAGLAVLSAAVLGILSIGRDHVFFVVPVVPPEAGQGLFASTPERAYVAIGLLIGLVVAPLQAASRALLARIAPADRVAQFFGLYALSARVTSFIGPFAVAVVTAATGSQKAGMAVLIVFFACGAALLSTVRIPR
jgi:UMF1 family MFS transporter